MPTTFDVIKQFLTEYPAAISTHGRRIKAIRCAHAEANVPLDLEIWSAPQVIRTGDQWAGISEALRHLPRTRYPVGLRGRRDAWLLVLVGTLGFTRSEAHSILESDVCLFPQMTIRNILVPQAELTKECPKCAVTRWLRISNLAAFGARMELRGILDPTLDQEVHDCWEGLNGEWRASPQLLPPIDRYGWVDNSQPLSLRSISTIVARCQGNPDPIEQAYKKKVATGRFRDASINDLADAYDDVDERLAALMLRTKEVLGESDELFHRITEIG